MIADRTPSTVAIQSHAGIAALNRELARAKGVLGMTRVSQKIFSRMWLRDVS